MKLAHLKKLMFEEHRLNTFQNWIYNNDENALCSADKMARAGFYVESEDDPSSAKCFCCLKTLNGWERHDDPFEEHRKHSPKCLFVKIGKEELNMTINEMLFFSEEVDTNLLKLEYLENVKHLEKLRREMKNKLIDCHKAL